MMSRSMKIVNLALALSENFSATDNSIAINDIPIIFEGTDADVVSCNFSQESLTALPGPYLTQANQEPLDEQILEVQENPTLIVLDALTNVNFELSSDFSMVQSSNGTSNPIVSEYCISDESDNNAVLVPYSEHSDSDRSSDEPAKKRVKRRKRCQVDESTWANRRNALSREKGQRYFGRRKQDSKWDNKVPKNSRKMKARCNCSSKNKCNSVLKCFEISDDERKKMFDAFWLLNWGEKRVYVDSLIKMLPTIRPRDRKDASKTKRSYSMYYYLKVNDEMLRVCKTMFLNTLDIGKTAVWNWKNGSKENFAMARNNNQSITEITSAKKSRKNAFQKQVDSLKEFLAALSKMEAHYCRKETSKNYLLPEWTSKKALYNFYVSDWCSSHNIVSLSVAKFYNTLETENISLFRPKKDECEKCMAHKLGFISDEEHALHMARKEEARAEKSRDKEKEEFVFAVDVQALLLAPKSNVSSLYYNSKLNIHNFCAFNLKTKEAYCFLWNETEGGVSAEEFSTVVVKLILDKFLPGINKNNNIKIIIYSDGCAAQNRNVTLSNALLNVAMTNNITIEQKYLEVGHTQMEVDSMHATTERRLQNKIINVPAEYIGICRSARKNPGSYNVEYLTHSFFKSYDDIKFYKSIRPGRMKGDAKVTDMRALQYTSNGSVFYKLRFTDEWQLLPQRRELIQPKEFQDFQNLHSSRLPITRRKFEDLQGLKTTIPLDYHSYYDNLPHL